MTEAEAAQRAHELNVELGRSGDQQAYYLEVEVSPGQWEVELRREEPVKEGWLSTVLGSLPF